MEKTSPNPVLLRGACLWLLMALLLAWCMVGINFGIEPLKALFQGRFTRLLQAHIDFLLMTALILGFHAARVPLPWHVRWAMVVGAFTNSSLFLVMAIFPELDNPEPSDHWLVALFTPYLLTSVAITTYGFGRGAVILLRSSFVPRSDAP